MSVIKSYLEVGKISIGNHSIFTRKSVGMCTINKTLKVQQLFTILFTNSIFTALLHNANL